MTQTLLGQKVHIVRPQPRMTCSPTFGRIQAPALVKETNEWMASFFGYENLLPDEQVYAVNQTLFMNERTYTQLLLKVGK